MNHAKIKATDAERFSPREGRPVLSSTNPIRRSFYFPATDAAGVVEKLTEYLRMRYVEAENQAAVERLAGNDPKYMVERAVMAEIHGIQDFVRDLPPAPAPAESKGD